MAESHQEIHLTADQKARLAKLADEVRKPWPEVFDEALAAYPSRPSEQYVGEESFYEAASRLGFIGCIPHRDTETAAQTNP